MNISVEGIKSPEEYPSKEDVELVFRLIGEMGLKEQLFTEEGFGVKFVHMEGKHRRYPELPELIIYMDGTFRPNPNERPIDAYHLSITLSITDGRISGCFTILNYSEYMLATSETPKYEAKAIADTGPDYLLWEKLAPLISEAQGIGGEYKDVRNQWWVYRPWSRLGGTLRHP